MNVTDLVRAIQGGLIQQDRLLKTEVPSLPNNALIPHRAVTHSELGRDYSVTLDMVSAAGDIELKSLISEAMTLWIQQADKSYLPINGYIHTAGRLGANGSLTSYQLTFASWMHFLKFRSDLRSWQDKSVDDIVSDVFNEHPQASGYFQFALSKPLPKRSYCRQSETDWNFVHRLLEDEGLYGFWRQSKDGKSHTLVITDDIYSLDAMSPEAVNFYRSGANSEADAFTQWAGVRTMQSALHTTRSFDYKSPSTPFNPKATTLPTRENQGNLPAQAEIYTYTGAYTYSTQDRGEHLSKIRLEEWESRAKRFYGVGSVRGIDAGLRFTLIDHPEHDSDPAGQREFAAIKVRRYVENNLPLSGQESSFPHSLQDELAQARARSGALAVGHADGSQGIYLVEVEAQRTTVPYRSPFEHKKPEMQLETAIVVGPKGEEVYTDELNRVKIMFVWDRLNPATERASCWVRVAQSDTGGGYGGVHPPRVGEEVIIGYIGGDCDRPMVLHRVFNGTVRPQWHSNGIMSGYRSKEYSGAGFNQMVMDSATGQNRVQLMSSSGNSLLHLGYLIDQNGNQRGSYLGSGFDLRSDAFGAVRAGQGLYVTTHPKSHGDGQLDVTAAQQQLTSAGGTMEALSNASAQHEAGNLKDGHDALMHFADATQNSTLQEAKGGLTAGGGTGSANAFKEALLLLAGPDGIGLSTQKSAHVAADQQINIASGNSMHLVAGESLLASVLEMISLFAQNGGIKQVAAKGNVDIQAQSGDMTLVAQKVLKLLSVADAIQVAADKEILLTCGGAYIRLTKDGNIQIHAPGTVDVKGSQHSLGGPARMNYALPLLPTADVHSGWFKAVDHTGQPIAGLPYQITHGAQIHYGYTDDEGKTHTVMNGSPDHMDVNWNPEHFEDPTAADEPLTC